MKSVLISNDDGIDADGIQALRRLAERLFDEVWVVAPVREASQIGHRVTTAEPINFEERGRQTFAVHGTPADCVRVGFHLMGKQPDWVWSGINHGGNLGRHDYFISGTLAAAREAAFFGVPSMGTSQVFKPGLPIDWDQAAERIGRGYEKILRQETLHGNFWSVNLPHLEATAPEPEVVLCDQEKQPLQVAFEATSDGKGLCYRGSYHDRPHSEFSDVDVCFGGNIALSRLEI